jgi:hypothetical protein
MLTSLKSTLARRPLAGFFVLAAAAYVAYSAFGLLVTRWSLSNARWEHRFRSVSVAVVGLIALLCCWAVSSLRDRPPRRLAQLFIIAGVAVLVTTASCVQVWLLWRAEVAGFPDFGTTGITPALEIRDTLVSAPTWLLALVAGLALAGVESRFSVVSRTSRALVTWRGPRVWLFGLVALLIPAACLSVATVGARLWFAGGEGTVTIPHSVAYEAATFVTLLLANVPLVFAWYGFVAERLARRASPLVAGLVIGLVVTLPYQLVIQIAELRSGGGFLLADTLYDLEIASLIAVAVPAVWLVRKACGSLVPTALLLATVSVGNTIAAWNASTADGYIRTEEIYQAGIIAAAVLITVAGRLWRRTEPAPPLPAPDESHPADDGAGLEPTHVW